MAGDFITAVRNVFTFEKAKQLQKIGRDRGTRGDVRKTEIEEVNSMLSPTGWARRVFLV